MPRFDESEPVLPEQLLFEATFPATEDARVEMLELLMAALKSNGLIRREAMEFQARLCLDEALINAVVHGSGRNKDLKVYVKLARNDREWAIMLEDQGTGFKAEKVPNYNDPNHIAESEGGRGLQLIDAYMDDFCYYGRGNVCVMVKRIREMT